MPSNEHAGFGRRPAGDDRWRHRYRARGPTSRLAPIRGPGLLGERRFPRSGRVSSGWGDRGQPGAVSAEGRAPWRARPRINTTQPARGLGVRTLLPRSVSRSSRTAPARPGTARIGSGKTRTLLDERGRRGEIRPAHRPRDALARFEASEFFRAEACTRAVDAAVLFGGAQDYRLPGSPDQIDESLDRHDGRFRRPDLSSGSLFLRRTGADDPQPDRLAGLDLKLD